MAEINQINNIDNSSEIDINIKELFFICLSKWKWFALSAVVMLVIAFLYIKHTTPVYNGIASVLIKDNRSSRSSIGSDIASSFSDMGLFTSRSNVYDERVAMQSPAIMSLVVNRLDLQTNYYAPGFFRDTVVYGSKLPLKVRIDGLDVNQGASFLLDLSKKDGKVTLSEFVTKGKKIEKGKSFSGTVGAPIITPVGPVTVETTAAYSPSKDYTLKIVRGGLYAVVKNYCSRFSAEMSDKQSSVLNLSFNDSSAERAKDVLEAIINVYNEEWVKDKNLIAVAASKFIDDRLSVIINDLGNVDKDISDYMSDNLITSLEDAAALNLKKSEELSDAMLKVSNQIYMAKYIREYISDPKNKNELIPANAGIENQGIAGQINNFNDALIQRNTIAHNSSENNPLVTTADAALVSMRQAVIISIDNELVALKEQMDKLRETDLQTKKLISETPTQATHLLTIERQQKVKESLYLYLLQKREENELSMSFNAYNTRILTPPTSGLLPVSPRKARILFIALFLGILLPFVVIVLRQTMDTKLRGKKDLEGLSVPFIGEIPLWAGEKKNKFRYLRKHKDEKKVVVQEGNRNVINEAFRVLRTNLDFVVGKNGPCNVISVTSFDAGSGKSYITVNLGVTLTLKGRKVLLIDGDLRHASTSSYINQPHHGLSEYLSGRTADIHEVIVSGTLHKNLDVLPVGPIPPNPTELLEEPGFASMLETLRNEYDIILIDCPPVDTVADTQIIGSLADRTIFVLRAGLLEREMIPELEKIYREKRFKNLCMIINGTESVSGTYSYRYGYGYGYGHRGGYYNTD